MSAEFKLDFQMAELVDTTFLAQPASMMWQHLYIEQPHFSTQQVVHCTLDTIYTLYMTLYG